MSSDIKLTGYTKFSGCGAKLGPGLLDKALCELSQPEYPELLVDYRNADDAGVWKINDNTALVQTVDFFPPIVDDPFDFGRIAAANALSDVYAMGGALDALKEAGAALVGGHSIKDEELKFGLAVTGLVHPERALKNNSPKKGDILILTKPIGTGCINRALKAGKASDRSIAASIQSMSALNKTAAGILEKSDVSACTDVSGFGLLGHVCEMISGSGCGANISPDQVETLPDAVTYINAGLVPGGTLANRLYREKWISNAGVIEENILNLLFDPQTSGGLLAAVHPKMAELALNELRESGIQAFSIGEIAGGGESIILVNN